MNEHFNQLTPAEAERLSLLMEECGEVIQIISKIQRHGYFSMHPDGGPTNSTLLETEIGHIKAAIGLMADADDVSSYTIRTSEEQKRLGYAAKKYLHHQ